MRRRYQRRLDDAMAGGLLLAPRAPGSKRKRFGTKPKLFDAWLADGGVTWDHIKVCSSHLSLAASLPSDISIPC